MEFYEARHRIRRVDDRRECASISDKDGRTQRNGLRVMGPIGRWWMGQERSGPWYIYGGGHWIAAPPPRPGPTSPSPGRGSHQGADWRHGGWQGELGESSGRTALCLAAWAVLWLLLALPVYVVWGQDGPLALVGVSVAAGVSLMLMLINRASHWSGQIVDIRIEPVHVERGEGDWHYEDRRYAYVRRENGKNKRVEAPGNWQIGDRLEKRQGEAHIRHHPQP